MAQGKLSSGWDGTNNGYSFPIDIDITDSLFSLVLPTFFLLLFSLVLIGFVVKKVHSGITTIEQRYYTLAVFYSVGIVTLGLNIIELCFSIYVFKNLTTVSGSSSEGLFIVALKGIYIAVSLFVTVSFAIVGWKKAKAFPNFSCCFCFCVTWHPKLRQRLIHSLIFLSVSYFCFSIVISICPTFLLVFVYPIEVISLLFFIGTLLFCIILVFAFIISYDMIREQVKASPQAPSQVESRLKPYALKFLQRSLYVLPCFAFVFLMYVYIKILVNTNYTGSNKILQAISSLLPSLGLGILGYYAKKRLKSFHDKHSEGLSSITDQKPATDTQENKVNDSESREQSRIEREPSQMTTGKQHMVKIENESSV